MADLEGGSKLDAHSGHEMVSLKQHQGLPINLLNCKVLDIVTAARKVLDEVAHLLHIPLERVVLGTDRGLLLGLLGRLLDNLLGLLDLDLGGERRTDNGAHHSLAANIVTALKLLLRRFTAVDVVERLLLLLLFLFVDGTWRSARSSLDRNTGGRCGTVSGRGARGLSILLL